MICVYLNSSNIHNVIKYLTVRLSGVNTATQVCALCAFLLKNIQHFVISMLVNNYLF